MLTLPSDCSSITSIGFFSGDFAGSGSCATAEETARQQTDTTAKSNLNLDIMNLDIKGQSVKNRGAENLRAHPEVRPYMRLVKSLDYSHERVSLEGGAADESAVNIGLREEFACICRLAAASVED